jgi:hypothetical protein
MASDHNAPRKSEEEPAAPESLAALHAPRGGAAKAADTDVEASDTAEGIELPGADLSREELVEVLQGR